MTTIKAQWPTTRAAPAKAAFRRVTPSEPAKPKTKAKSAPEPEPTPAQAPEPATPVQAPEPTPIVAMGYQIAHDPIPPHRTMPGKYAELFAQWPQGAAVRCATKEARVLADALRRYLKRTGQPGKASVCSHYPGDTQTPGRVWWLAE